MSSGILARGAGGAGTGLRELGRKLAILRAAMRRLALMLSIGAALALGACGGDDNNNASTTTASTPTTATQPATGTTGKSGKKGKKKSGKSNGSGGGSSTSTGGTTKTGTQTQTQTQAQTQTTPAPAAASPYKTAKTVCGTILPNVVKRQLKKGQTTKKKVAKSYSKGWPSDQRNQAYRGCLAGLK